MDPQNALFQPQPDIWHVVGELQRLQTIQTEHSDRLSRVERRQEDTSRIKSVWGGSSPFPSILSGTPNQGI